MVLAVGLAIVNPGFNYLLGLERWPPRGGAPVILQPSPRTFCIGIFKTCRQAKPFGFARQRRTIGRLAGFLVLADTRKGSIQKKPIWPISEPVMGPLTTGLEAPLLSAR